LGLRTCQNALNKVRTEVIVMIYVTIFHVIIVHNGRTGMGKASVLVNLIAAT